MICGHLQMEVIYKMKELKYPPVRTFFIANSNDGKIIHYGVTETDQVTTTGQSVFNTYSKIEDCKKRLLTDLKLPSEKLIEQPIDFKNEEIINNIIPVGKSK